MNLSFTVPDLNRIRKTYKVLLQIEYVQQTTQSNFPPVLIQGLMSSWDSQVTLVDSKANYELAFTTRSMLNNILLLDGSPRFVISTLENASSAITKVTDFTTSNLLCTIRRRSLHADDIKFEHYHDGKTLKIKELLREGTSNDGYMSWTVDYNNALGSFVWRVHPTLRLALCPANELDNPIAWLRQVTPTETAALVLKHGTESFLEEILATYVVLELKLRVKDAQMAKAVAYMRA